MPDGIKEDDFECKCSDDKLDECLETNDEEIVSSNITISPNKKKKITSKVYLICMVTSIRARTLFYKPKS